MDSGVVPDRRRRHVRRIPRLPFLDDARSGITVLAASVPIGIALGIASGMGPLAGLWCVVIVGFLAAVFGATKALMSGPSAALAVTVSVILAGSVGLAELAIIVIMAGAFQTLFGVFGIGRIVGYIPHVVLQGFISGIGILLCLSQIQNMLGTDIPAHGGALSVLSALPAAVLVLEPDNVVVAAVTFAILALWPPSLARWMPSILVALVVSTAFGALWFDRAAVLGALPSGLPEFHLALPSFEFVLAAVEPALLLALIGSIYTLMMSLVADSITGAQHDPNRELIGQGIGNMTAGALGAMPGAATFDARGGVLAFQGTFTVASSRKLVRLVGADIRDHEFVIFDFSRVTQIDDSAAHVIGLLIDLAEKENTDVIVAGVPPDVGNTLHAFDALRRVPEERIVSTLHDARRLARKPLQTS